MSAAGGAGEGQVVIRPVAAGDDEAVASLWREVLGDSWPVAPAALAGQLRAPSAAHFLAERAGGGAVGLVLAHHEEGSTGAVAALLVRREDRRQGIGTRLLDAGVAAMEARGAREIRLGGPPGPYLWPGVPTNADGAQAFFERRDGAFTDVTSDLTLDLRGYATPPAVSGRAAAAGVVFALATPADEVELLRFEEEHFPRWHGTFARALAAGRHHDVVLARLGGAVVGSALLDPPDPGFVWDPLLPGAGQFGVVGVAEHARHRGVGLALSARCCELQQERGVPLVYVGWVWSAGWYAQLGCRVWRVYLRGSRGP